MSHDPRAVANLLLDCAEGCGLNVTNLALQKLLYFAHAQFLVQTGRPLVYGAFEAWQHGPVHPAVYKAFKSEGASPIRIRAAGLDIRTGRSQPLPVPSDPEVGRCIRRVLDTYGHLSAARLRQISHAKKGPWDTIVRHAQRSVALGMRIPDSVTRQCFRCLDIVVESDARIGDLYEDAPFAGD